MSEWQKIPESKALNHTLYGIRGWLIVFVIGTVVGTLHNFIPVNMLAMELNKNIFDIINSLPRAIKIMVYYDLLTNIIILWMMFDKYSKFRIVTSWLIAGKLVIWIVILQSNSENLGLVVRDAGMAIISIIIWLSYLNKSERVRVTYEHQIKLIRGQSSNVPAINQGPSISNPKNKAVFSNGINNMLGKVRVSSKEAQPEKTSTVTKTIPDDKSMNKDQNLDSDELYYKIAWQELQVKSMDAAVWSRAYAENDGDNKKTCAAYIRLRVYQLKSHQECRPENPDCYDENGHTALMRSVISVNLNEVAELLKSGVDRTIKDGNFNTSTALDIANRSLKKFNNTTENAAKRNDLVKIIQLLKYN